ncbi:MAG: hypothetical protein Athens101428_504 [Candidatus Berkelbacteria bacterium Athens1014_28]|uniref:Lipoprotein n=1 Tax=Candidatus Berkelbacteria bacterium Athens1014_28 TaxID=2017145 RepID=A0A554LLV6_9BACT|nr:MAG: hypothetical protein Athens101428_504 [Candidatus Berkelbacteria bacterium Athens1014_28]
MTKKLLFLFSIGAMSLVFFTGCIPDKQSKDKGLDEAINRIVTDNSFQENLTYPENSPSTDISDEAREFGLQVIQPILDRAKNDPIPGIRSTIKQLFKLLESGKAGIAVAPVANGAVIAFTHFDRQCNTQEIVFAGPVIQEFYETLSTDDFRDKIIEVACHETLHLVYTPSGKNNPKIDSKVGQKKYQHDEKLVWEKQIALITRPMLKVGRSVDPLAKSASDVYKQFGDNHSSKGWKKWVNKHLCISPEKMKNN